MASFNSHQTFAAARWACLAVVSLVIGRVTSEDAYPSLVALPTVRDLLVCKGHGFVKIMHYISSRLRRKNRRFSTTSVWRFLSSASRTRRLFGSMRSGCVARPAGLLEMRSPPPFRSVSACATRSRSLIPDNRRYPGATSEGRLRRHRRRGRPFLAGSLLRALVRSGSAAGRDFARA